MFQASSMEHAHSILKHRIRGLRTISFDVFDTLLARRVDPPDLIHQRVAQQLAVWIDHPNWQSLLHKRYEVERQLRESAHTDGYDHECDIESILRDWILAVGMDDRLLTEKILQYELNLERQAIYLQPGTYELVSWLHQQDVKIFALSDVYLNAKYLHNFFDHLDIRRFFTRIYSSADRRICKYSSKLFDFLIKEDQIDPDTHLHIGDNKFSDYMSPIKLGMHAIYLHDAKSISRRRKLQRYKALADKSSILKGKYFYQVLTEGRATKFANFYERYGYQILAPIFSLFALGLVQKLNENKNDAIYFVARDGYLLMQLAKRLVDAGYGDSSLKNKFKYLYVSRKTGFAAMAADGLQIEEARIGLFSPPQKCLASLLRSFSLSDLQFRDLAQKHGFSGMDDPIHDLFDIRLNRFFADVEVQQRIKGENAKYKADFLDYLRQEGLFDARRLAIVDIGWNGTIQYALHKLTEASQPRPSVNGYYLAYSAGTGYPWPNDSFPEGIIYDELRKHPGEKSILHFEEIFEEAARSTEGTTIGYERCADGSIRPVLKSEDSTDRIEEKNRDQEIQYLRRGILAGLETFIQTLNLTGFDFQDLKAFSIYHLERALIYPTADEVFHLSRLTHAVDFGHNATLDLESIRTRRMPVFYYFKFLREVYTSEWVYGKMTGLWFNMPRYLMRVRELSRLNGHA